MGELVETGGFEVALGGRIVRHGSRHDLKVILAALQGVVLNQEVVSQSEGLER